MCVESWWAMTGSNRRPPPCKGDALPTELIAHVSTLLLPLRPSLRWWVMTGSNRRPPPCKGDALPTELITPAVWSRIIGIRRNESTLFKIKMFVRFNFSQDVAVLNKTSVFLCVIPPSAAYSPGKVVEESPSGGRMQAINSAPN